MLRIAPATPDDAPAILGLVQALAEYERARPECQATEAGLRATLFGDERQAECVIAWEGTSPVGLAIFFHNYSTWLARHGLYLEDLFVLPTHRSKGYGRALLKYLAKLAIERGCGRFEWAVLDWNEPAIGFYKALGAKPMDEWTVYRMSGDALARLASDETP
jgi:GNAT superfamily N-acetyltransferase